MGVQIETSSLEELYSKWNNVVKENIPNGTTDPLRLRVAEALKELRSYLGFSQSQMSIALNVSQGQIAKWEGAKQTPPGQAFAAISRLAPEEQKGFWLKLAGLEDVAPVTEMRVRSIPLLRDAAAAGTPRAIDEKEIDQQIALPKEWLPRGGTLYAIRVSGNSMEPIVLDGSIVIIDTSRRDPSKLDRRMVAARDDTGVTVKWLRYSAKGISSLVPQHTAPQHDVLYLQPHGEFSVVGEVVMWIGTPPPARRK